MNENKNQGFFQNQGKSEDPFSLTVNGIIPVIKLSGEIYEIGETRMITNKRGEEYPVTDFVIQCDDEVKTKLPVSMFDTMEDRYLGCRCKVMAIARGRKHGDRWFTSIVVKSFQVMP